MAVWGFSFLGFFLVGLGVGRELPIGLSIPDVYRLRKAIKIHTVVLEPFPFGNR